MGLGDNRPWKERPFSKRKMILVAFSIVLNVLWFFIPLAGETGLEAIVESVNTFVGILISLVALGYFVGVTTLFLLKK